MPDITSNATNQKTKTTLFEGHVHIWLNQPCLYSVLRKFSHSAGAGQAFFNWKKSTSCPNFGKGKNDGTTAMIFFWSVIQNVRRNYFFVPILCSWFIIGVANLKGHSLVYITPSPVPRGLYAGIGNGITSHQDSNNLRQQQLIPSPGASLREAIP